MSLLYFYLSKLHIVCIATIDSSYTLYTQNIYAVGVHVKLELQDIQVTTVNMQASKIAN